MKRNQWAEKITRNLFCAWCWKGCAQTPTGGWHRLPRTRSCLQHHLLAGVTWTLAHTDNSPPLEEAESQCWEHTLSTPLIYTNMHISGSLERWHGPFCLATPKQITAYTSGLTPAADPTSIHTAPGSTWCLQQSHTHTTHREHTGLQR